MGGISVLSVALVSTAILAGSIARAAGPAPMSPAPDHRALTPAGSLFATQGQFPAGALLDPTAGRVLVADANKTLDYLESFSAADPSVSAATVPTAPLTPPPAQAPDVQSGHLFLAGGGTVYAAGGATGTVRAFNDAGAPVQTATYQVGAINPLQGPGDLSGYIGDVVALADGHTLLASEPFAKDGGKGHNVVRYDTTTTSVTGSVPVGRHPLAMALSPANAGPQRVAVANQDDGTVSIVAPDSMSVLRTVATGRQPDALAFTPDGSHLLVVDSLDDELVVLRGADWAVVSRVKLSASAGLGAEPSALSLSADGKVAYVALSADNALAVIPQRPGDADTWALAGLIPTARYPTAVAVDDARRQLFVTAGKAGATTTADMPENLGALEQIPTPDAQTLAADTARVAANNEVAPSGCATGNLAGIDHVVYVIRENKTYDTEFGDEPGGSPSDLMYGRSTTPNAHALAERYVLMENFSSDEEVSDTAHQTVMGGVANDWVQRFVEQSYNLGGAERPGAELGNDDDILWAPNNYLLDSALAAQISFRDYGEFYRRDQTTDAAVSAALDAHVVHGFPGFGFDPGTPDTKRVAFWQADFANDVAHRTFPQLEVVYLPEDHTTSGVAATSSAQTQVADADLALGRLIAALSNSPYWPSTAVFMTEDDPQDGMDHIDPHRSLGLIAGGHVREGVQTTVPYDQLSMLRTIEQILGLPPLTEHDATARPMDSLFDPGRVDDRPYGASPPSPPPTSGATLRRMHSLARRWFGADATPQSIVDRVGNASFALQWLSTHGALFHPTPGRPGPGQRGEANTRARRAFDRAAVRAAASTPDCQAAVTPTLSPAGVGSARAHRRLGLRVRHRGRRVLRVSGSGDPGATIALSFRRRHGKHVVQRRVHADASGRFLIYVRGLTPGAYRIVARVQGQRPVSRRALVGRGARRF